MLTVQAVHLQLNFCHNLTASTSYSTFKSHPPTPDTTYHSLLIANRQSHPKALSPTFTLLVFTNLNVTLTAIPSSWSSIKQQLLASTPSHDCPVPCLPA